MNIIYSLAFASFAFCSVIADVSYSLVDIHKAIAASNIVLVKTAWRSLEGKIESLDERQKVLELLVEKAELVVKDFKSDSKKLVATGLVLLFSLGAGSLCFAYLGHKGLVHLTSLQKGALGFVGLSATALGIWIGYYKDSIARGHIFDNISSDVFDWWCWGFGYKKMKKQGAEKIVENVTKKVSSSRQQIVAAYLTSRLQEVRNEIDSRGHCH